MVAVPRRDILKLRLRVGLRSEDPIELATATLGNEPTPLAAPSQLPPTTGGAGERVVRELQAGPPPQGPGAPPRRPPPAEGPGAVPLFHPPASFAHPPPAPHGPSPA